MLNLNNYSKIHNKKALLYNTPLLSLMLLFELYVDSMLSDFVAGEALHHAPPLTGCIIINYMNFIINIKPERKWDDSPVDADVDSVFERKMEADGVVM